MSFVRRPTCPRSGAASALAPLWLALLLAFTGCDGTGALARPAPLSHGASFSRARQARSPLSEDAIARDLNRHCPCDAPWPNHGAYVRCVVRRIAELVRAGKLTPPPGRWVARAARGELCGSPPECETGFAFVPTGSMSTPRRHHTATRLVDGRVLITGGSNDTGELASAEIYDPDTGTFTPTAPMQVARERHTATRLPDGRVLIVGGRRAGVEDIAVSEVYDPAQERFLPAAPLAHGRQLHTATRLLDGRVLVAGGYAAVRASGEIIHVAEERFLDSIEIYDPAAGGFTDGGRLLVRRSRHAAARLADGRVLFVGGHASVDGREQELASAEVYDPAHGSLTLTAPW